MTPGLSPLQRAEYEVRELRQELQQRTRELEVSRAMLTNVCAAIEAEMGQHYKDAVTKACGDISVTTAFKLAQREEREAAEHRYTSLLGKIQGLYDRDLVVALPNNLGGYEGWVKWADLQQALTEEGK